MIESVRVAPQSFSHLTPPPIDWGLQNTANKVEHYSFNTASPTININGLTYYQINTKTAPDRIVVKNSTSIDWVIGFDAATPPTLGNFDGYIQAGSELTQRLTAGSQTVMLIPFTIEGNWSNTIEVYLIYGAAALPEPSIGSVDISLPATPAVLPQTSIAAGAYLNIITPQPWDLFLDEGDIYLSSAAQVELMASYIGDEILRWWVMSNTVPYRYDLGGFRLLKGYTFRVHNVGATTTLINVNQQNRRAF
ncbi:MAG: hypothetical protein KGJ01_02450 [Patescibacteria group bacterium]|nr:hypothetical protein [Patescibacteria group bacterium]